MSAIHIEMAEPCPECGAEVFLNHRTGRFLHEEPFCPLALEIGADVVTGQESLGTRRVR